MPAIRFGYLESEDEMKRACTMVAVMFLLLGLAACAPRSTSTPAVLPTVSHTPLPAITRLPVASRTPLPTMTRVLATTAVLPTVTGPLLTPTGPAPASMWEILFWGSPCLRPEEECELFEDTKFYYYSINSDGTGLKEIPAFPPLPTPPESMPAHYLGPPPQLSPDGSLWAYVAMGGLYLFDTGNGQSRLLVPSKSRLPALCWTLNGAIIFADVKRGDKWEDVKDVFYVIDVNGEHLRPLFTISHLVGDGDCSPDRRELAFTPGKGLYVADLITGEWRKVLSDYLVTVIRTAPKVP